MQCVWKADVFGALGHGHLDQGQSLLCLLVAAEEHLLPRGPLSLGAGSLDRIWLSKLGAVLPHPFLGSGVVGLGRSLLGLGEQVPH